MVPAQPMNRFRSGFRAADGAVTVAIAALVLMLYCPAARSTFVMNDDGVILEAARRITRGLVPGKDFPVLYTPGEFYLVAGVLQWWGWNWIAYRGMDIAVRMISAVLLYHCARRLANRPTAFCASLVSILVPGHWHKSSILAVALVILWLALRWMERPSRGRLAGLGLSIGVGALFRQDTGLLVGAVAGAVVASLPPRRKDGSGPSVRPAGRLRRASILAGSAFVPFVAVHLVLHLSLTRYFQLPLRLLRQPAETRFTVPYPSPIDMWGALWDGHAGRALELSFFYWPFVVVGVELGRILEHLWKKEEPWELGPRLLFAGAAGVLAHQVVWLSNYGHLIQALALPMAMTTIVAGRHWRVVGSPQRRRHRSSSLVAGVSTAGVMAYVIYNTFVCTDPSTGSPIRVRSLHSYPIQTAMGELRVDPDRGPAIAAILERINIASPPGTPIFAFPMLSGYYALSGHPNPTPFDALGHSTYRAVLPHPAAEKSLADRIAESGVRIVLLDEPITHLGTTRIPSQRLSFYARRFLEELLRHFQVTDLIGTTIILERRMDPAAAASERSTQSK